MPIEKIYSFLTYPKKNKIDEELPSGTSIPLDQGKLCKMLGDIFDNAATQCNIPVMFTSEDKVQANPVRSELQTIFKKPSIATVAQLAARLQKATSGTSGMGLLFICIGPDAHGERIVISRFPADEGVVAERTSTNLTVSFVEQVFLKSAHSFKAATYVSTGKVNELWTGYAVDKQINHGSKAMADYWIIDFLLSDMATTGAAGTKRLALALKATLTSTTDVNVKREITSAVHLAANIPNKALTISEFCDSFHLSPQTKSAISAKVNPSRLINEKFKFDQREFGKHIAYKQVELDNGAVLTAPVEKFEECFKTTQKQNSQPQNKPCATL